MKKSIAALLSAVLVVAWGWVGNASAHISNETQIYQDLKDSPAKVEITKLRAFGIIPNIKDQNNFKPKADLDKETLGSWLANAAKLKGHTDNPTPKEMSEEAVEKGLIDNLNGTATYKDVMTGILKIIGVKQVTEPAEQAEELGILNGKWHDLVDQGGKATRENAVLLFDMSLDKKGPSGQSMLALQGIKQGPTGIVDDVMESKTTVDGKEKETFMVTIGGQKFPFYGEGKIALFTGLLAAKGKKVNVSYVKSITENGKSPEEMVIFLQGEGAATPSVGKPSDTQKEVKETNVAASSQKEPAQTSSSLGVIWTVVMVVLLAVGVGIFASGRKKA